MKTGIILTSAVLMFLLHSVSLFGQDSIRKFIPVKSLVLKGGSGEQEVKLPIRDSLTYINFEIKAKINSGELTVELLDPNGEKYGNFSIAGSLRPTDKDTEIIRGQIYQINASGSLVRYVNYPIRGMWKARVITKNATGVINFNLTREMVTVFSIH